MFQSPSRFWISYTICLFLPLVLSRLSRCAAQDAQQPLSPKVKQPNIIFILTDDQDLHMDSLSYMPYLKKHLTDRGTSFERHYCTVALCCPSRVSLWTGKAAHNTNVTDVNPPWGGYPKFLSQGFNSAYLPVWLQSLGYSTYYIGKLFNAQTVDNYASPESAAGWTGSEFLLDPYTYEYLNATFTRNGGAPRSYEGQYTTDLVRDKSLAYLDDALAGQEPFFLTIAPTAPHSNVHQREGLVDGNFTEKSNIQSPPIPAARHAHLFPDVVVPRTPHFNPASPHSVSWIRDLPHQNQTNVAFNDHFYRSRLRALQSVDELIDAVVTRLSTAGILDETYLVFSTDNGYHIGQHRLQPGKQCAFEEDIHIPLIVRGPGVPVGHVSDLVTTHTDLAPTFLSLAAADAVSGFSEKYAFDGAAIPLRADALRAAEMGDEPRSEHVNVEMWGIIMSEGKYGAALYANHTYKAVRVVGKGYSWLYTVWCSGERELYDVSIDPYQTTNIHPRASQLLQQREVFGPQQFQPRGNDVFLHRLLSRLDTLLMVLKTCRRRTCTHPWESIHPGNAVRNLRDALDEKYDEFYFAQERVEFTRCEKGYIAESEGKMWEEVGGYSFDVGG